MRLFIAIPLPKNIIKELVNVQNQVGRVGCKIRYVKNFHLTLLFLGEISNSTEIKEKLSKISFNQFKLSLTEIGVFPNWQKPRVLWVGLTENPELMQLQKNIEKALNFTANKEFKAHITVGRIKFIKNKRNFKDIVANAKLQKESFEVKSFELIKSTLLPEGPVYEVLESFI